MSSGDPWTTDDGTYVGHFAHLRVYLTGDDTLVPFNALSKARRAWAYPTTSLPSSLTADEVRDHRDEARYLEPRLRAAFEQQNGKIVIDFYCRHAIGAAALTDTAAERSRDPGRPARGLHTVLNTSSERLITAESRCHGLVNDAVTVLGEHRSDRTNLVFSTNTAYNAMSAVLLAADTLADPDRSPAERKAAMAGCKRQVQLATERVRLLVQRHARFSYFIGVLWGSLLALVICVLLGLITATQWSDFISTRSLVTAMVFGVFGAVTSVFQRISSGQLVLDFTAPNRQLLLLGGLRPFIGALFGAVLQFGVVAGLLTGQGQAGASVASVGFFAIVGFAAGFSERFATDMVERAGRLLAGPSSSAPSESAEASTDSEIGAQVTDDEVDTAAREDGPTGTGGSPTGPRAA